VPMCENKKYSAGQGMGGLRLLGGTAREDMVIMCMTLGAFLRDRTEMTLLYLSI
jgi:hypothetical protein